PVTLLVWHRPGFAQPHVDVEEAVTTQQVSGAHSSRQRVLIGGKRGGRVCKKIRTCRLVQVTGENVLGYTDIRDRRYLGPRSSELPVCREEEPVPDRGRQARRYPENPGELPSTHDRIQPAGSVTEELTCLADGQLPDAIYVDLMGYVEIRHALASCRSP